MRRHVAVTAVLWALLTLGAELAILNVDLLAWGAAREARISDEAFDLLLILGVPVFAFVVAVLLYSLLAFRARGDPGEDGPALYGRGLVGPAWLAVTGVLALFVIVHPGLTGLAKIRGEQHADLVVRVTGFQWGWRFEYPEQGITSGEIVLPVGTRTKFEVTSTDVIHSFWIPAFRVKVDAVPGLWTSVYVTPEDTGRTQDDAVLRLQCAEMCGFGHFAMRAGVRVVEQAEFDAWVAETKEKQR